MHEQTEAAGFETTSVTAVKAAQDTAGEAHADVEMEGKMLICGGTKNPRLLDRD
jgi:hypothetical protein